MVFETTIYNQVFTHGHPGQWFFFGRVFTNEIVVPIAFFLNVAFVNAHHVIINFNILYRFVNFFGFFDVVIKSVGCSFIDWNPYIRGYVFRFFCFTLFFIISSNHLFLLNSRINQNDIV